jgi:hypothetical protein
MWFNITTDYRKRNLRTNTRGTSTKSLFVGWLLTHAGEIHALIPEVTVWDRYFAHRCEGSYNTGSPTPFQVQIHHWLVGFPCTSGKIGDIHRL